MPYKASTVDRNKDEVPEPAARTVLKVIGVISVIVGSLCIIAGLADSSNVAEFPLGISALTGGFVLIGFSSGLALLTKIASYLRRIASTLEAPKPDSDKRTEAIRNKLEPSPVVQTKPTEPGIYKL
jgi:energy-converting hydrogenase Eha subunit E